MLCFFQAATWPQCFRFLPGLIGSDSVAFSSNDRDPNYFRQLCQESLFVLTLLRTPPLCSCVTCFPVSLLSPPSSSFILSPGASPHLSKITWKQMQTLSENSLHTCITKQDSSTLIPVISKLTYYLFVYERQESGRTSLGSRPQPSLCTLS